MYIIVYARIWWIFFCLLHFSHFVSVYCGGWRHCVSSSKFTFATLMTWSHTIQLLLFSSNWFAHLTTTPTATKIEMKNNKLCTDMALTTHYWLIYSVNPIDFFAFIVRQLETLYMHTCFVALIFIFLGRRYLTAIFLYLLGLQLFYRFFFHFIWRLFDL